MKDKPIKRGRPRKVADSKSNRTIHIMVGESLFAWLDEEWHRRRLQTRADAVRAILEEARARE